MADGKMTSAGYWGQLHAWGITKCHPGSAGGWVCQDRDGDFLFVDDPLWMTSEERMAALSGIALRRDLID
ncbi:MAG: hypothetical protein AAFY51_09095 [Pseudomonadota bacterium]